MITDGSMNFYLKAHLHKRIKAFTLVEILVVLALFSAITSLSLGSLINVRSISNRLKDQESVFDNLNFSLQIMTRDIRFGSAYYCIDSLPTNITELRRDCPHGGSGGTVLMFKPTDVTSSTDRVMYYIRNGIVYKDEYFGGSTTTLQITSDEVSVKNLKFFVTGALTAVPGDTLNDGGGFDYKQPLITIVISGVIKNARTNSKPTNFDIQTSVSSRIVDNR